MWRERERRPEDLITWAVVSFLPLTTHVATSLCHGSVLARVWVFTFGDAL